MRVLGYVNRYSWGVLEVQDRLEKNGNGLPEFDLSLVTAFLVKERISPKGAEARRYAIEQGYMMAENGGNLTSDLDIDSENGHEKRSDLTIFEDENNQKPSKTAENGHEKRSDLTIPEFPTLLIKNVYELLKFNRKAKYSEMSDNLGVSEATIKRAISWLKENGYINPEHSKVKGEWQLL